jgi:hypothetical protein
MMLRLVLFGMVAALGVSIPSQPGCEHWYGSAQAWTTALLAEWDSWEPADDGSGPRLVGRLNHAGCEECRLARMRLAVNIEETRASDASVAQGKGTAKGPETEPLAAGSTTDVTGPKASSASTLELIRVDDSFDAGIAYELNRMSEGLDHQGTGPSVSEALSTPCEVPVAELGIWCELYRIAREPNAVTAADEISAAPRSDSTASERSYICGFGDFDWAQGASSEGLPEPAEEAGSTAAKPVELEGYTEIPISCLEEGWDTDACLDDFDDAPRGIAIFVDLPRDVFVPEPVSASRSAAISSVMPVFGTLAYMRRGAEPAAGVAKSGALKPFTGAVPWFGSLVFVPSFSSAKRMIEPAGAVVAELPKPARAAGVADLPDDVFTPASGSVVQKPGSGDQPIAGAQSPPQRLGDAVELTRRAVSAWVSVLIGPALVEVSRR